MSNRTPLSTYASHRMKITMVIISLKRKRVRVLTSLNPLDFSMWTWTTTWISLKMRGPPVASNLKEPPWSKRPIKYWMRKCCNLRTSLTFLTWWAFPKTLMLRCSNLSRVIKKLSFKRSQLSKTTTTTRNTNIAAQCSYLLISLNRVVRRWFAPLLFSHQFHLTHVQKTITSLLKKAKTRHEH